MDRRVLRATTALLLTGIAGTAWTAERPVVVVASEEVRPARLEVHVGEIVTWRGHGDARLRLELDRHPGGHDVIERTGEVRVVFLEPGAHTYTVTAWSGRPLRGTVVVQPDEWPWAGPRECAPGSFDRICVAP